MRIIKFFVIMSSALPNYLVTLGSKYLPQDPIFEHPQPI